MEQQSRIEALIDAALNRQTESGHHPPWDCLALVGLTSVNQGHNGAYLYKAALEKTPAESRHLLWRRYIDALSEMLIIVGMPKTLNALYAMMPLVDRRDLAYVKRSDWEADNSARGWEYARRTHGDGWPESFKAASVYAPDVAHIAMNVSMQNLLSDDAVHDGQATMALLVTVLIAMNCPVQASWHAKGFIRHGGDKQSLHHVAEFAKKIALVTGNKLPADFPTVEAMLEELEGSS
ncbi:hypothetical protein HDV57DRAFT_505229 [Trichoderma longibrachiatum]|uniref:Uncharacterized protein n=1 Tax=Trichoderma longibrachiatum ATCC 18648 TaxID=983965 RepID=A0A2T4BTF4_TRILO|nr:hypothetical protein M440DRAFT_1383656 [Trichoderma longibrachiatum ATCC 18648]